MKKASIKIIPANTLIVRAVVCDEHGEFEQEVIAELSLCLVPRDLLAHTSLTSGVRLRG